MFLLCACLHACVGVCQECHAACDQMVNLLCWRKRFGLKCHFCQEGGMRIQMYSTVSASGLFTEPEACAGTEATKYYGHFSSVAWIQYYTDSPVSNQNLFTTAKCLFVCVCVFKT